jgi:hypothetical protein
MLKINKNAQESCCFRKKKIVYRKKENGSLLIGVGLEFHRKKCEMFLPRGRTILLGYDGGQGLFDVLATCLTDCP